MFSPRRNSHVIFGQAFLWAVPRRTLEIGTNVATMVLDDNRKALGVQMRFSTLLTFAIDCCGPHFDTS
jgi:hypothetical protein